MKKIIVLFALLVGSSAFGQFASYQIKGKITLSALSEFIVGRTYSLHFALNESALPSPNPDLNSPVFAEYPLGAAALEFNYDDGAYIGTIDTAPVSILNYSLGNNATDVLTIRPRGGIVNFPDVGGLSVNTLQGSPFLSLFDSTGTAFTSTKIADISNLDQFTGAGDQFGIFYGTLEQGISRVFGSVDSIERVELSPVPEPSTYGLAGSLVLAGLAAVRKYRKTSKGPASLLGS